MTELTMAAVSGLHALGNYNFSSGCKMGGEVPLAFCAMTPSTSGNAAEPV